MDHKGRFIINGDGTVMELKKVQGTEIEAQRLNPILCPMSDAMQFLHGPRDTLPNIGQSTAVMAEKDSYSVLDSEYRQSAHSLFRLPLSSARPFTSAEKVKGDAVMAWTPAVALAQTFRTKLRGCFLTGVE